MDCEQRNTFQVLIGRLKTGRAYILRIVFVQFQVLIGRLKTRNALKELENAGLRFKSL